MPAKLPRLTAETDDTQIVAAPWEMFLAWFKEVWEPGQHVALIGPTGEGKTTCAVHLLNLRKWVLALDPKGEDATLQASGFERILDWPPTSKTRDDVAEGKPARLIVGGSLRTDQDKKRLVGLMHDALKGVRAEGGWTCYADEFQILCDRRMYGLDKELEEMLVAARSRGTSVVVSFQAPAWVPKAATRQATYSFIWPTRDVVMIKTVAESMGRDWHDLIAAVRELPSYHALVIPKKTRAPMVLIHPPRIN